MGRRGIIREVGGRSGQVISQNIKYSIHMAKHMCVFSLGRYLGIDDLLQQLYTCIHGVAIVRNGICTSDIVTGAGIVYCARNRS